MTDEEKRIAIAEACGWSTGRLANNDGVWFNPQGKMEESGQLPDYLNDLNAMRDAIQAQPINIRKAIRSEVWRLSDQMEVLPNASVFADAFIATLGLEKKV